MLRKSLFTILTLLTVLAVAKEAPGNRGDEKKPCCGHQKAAVEKTENLQTLCPVMKGEIDKNIYVDHEGSRIYFCCQACVETFKKDPDTYLKRLEETGVTLYKAPCCDNNECKGCKKHHKETNKT